MSHIYKGTLGLIGNTPLVEVVHVEPEDSPVLSEGRSGSHKIQGIGAGFVPDVLNTKVYDEVLPVKNEDAFAAAKKLAKKEGMLDQNHFKQYHRGDAWTSVILAVQRLHHFVKPLKIHCRVYFSQKMLLKNQTVYSYDLDRISIHFPAFQHFASPFFMLPQLQEKTQP